MSKKKRIPIPPDISAKVLFMSDRTCCVCNEKGKPVQIHHIDENPANNNIDNLSILCFDCHTETMIKGGFHKKLDSEQILLYREHWYKTVSQNRAIEKNQFYKKNDDKDTVDIELATSVAEIYRENEEYKLLAFHYISIGNDELRDKYIEKAINSGIEDSTLIYFRSIQNKTNMIPKGILNKRIASLEKQKNFSELGRLYRDIGQPEESVKNTCSYIINALNEKNVFSAAFYLKEMVSSGDLESLFMIALKKAKENDDFWWELRSFQELDWDSEIDSFFQRNKEKILSLNDKLLLKGYYRNIGDWENYSKLRKEEAKEESAKS